MWHRLNRPILIYRLSKKKYTHYALQCIYLNHLSELYQCEN